MIFISFLGKFAQRSNLTQTKRMTEPKELFAYLDSDAYEVRDAQMVNDETIEIQYTEKEGFIEQSNKTNIVIAAFTTAYARLKLYDLLDLLQERVLYYDTDSVIYVHKPGKPDPPLGKYLGELTDELVPGDHITTFVSGGPKNYGYETNNGSSIVLYERPHQSRANPRLRGPHATSTHQRSPTCRVRIEYTS